MVLDLKKDDKVFVVLILISAVVFVLEIVKVVEFEILKLFYDVIVVATGDGLADTMPDTGDNPIYNTTACKV